jgi:hypothetical protein
MNQCDCELSSYVHINETFVAAGVVVFITFKVILSWYGEQPMG